MSLPISVTWKPTCTVLHRHPTPTGASVTTDSMALYKCCYYYYYFYALGIKDPEGFGKKIRRKLSLLLLFFITPVVAKLLSHESSVECWSMHRRCFLVLHACVQMTAVVQECCATHGHHSSKLDWTARCPANFHSTSMKSVRFGNSCCKVTWHLYGYCCSCITSVSLRFNGYFPGEPELAITRISPFWIYWS